MKEQLEAEMQAAEAYAAGRLETCRFSVVIQPEEAGARVCTNPGVVNKSRGIYISGTERRLIGMISSRVDRMANVSADPCGGCQYYSYDASKIGLNGRNGKH